MTPSALQQILTVSYDDNVRGTMVRALTDEGGIPAPCSSFVEAETLALTHLYSGMLVDLTSIIKAKGEDKIVATSLQNTFPMLRVKVLGPMLIPMVMSGTAAQEKSLKAFLANACATFTPRRLRAFRRHNYNTPIMIRLPDGSEIMSFSLDVSWGGIFAVVTGPTEIHVGEEVTVRMPALDIGIKAAVVRVKQWGEHKVIPGFGLRWHTPLSPEAENALLLALHSAKEFDRDRMIG